MKLLYGAVVLLAATAIASPRRRYNQNKRTNVQAPTVLNTNVDSTDDLKAYAEEFYKKHGSQYQKEIQSLVVKLQNGLNSGRSMQQKQANIENIIKNNASKFGMTYAEARDGLEENKEVLTELLNTVNVNEIKSTLNSGVGSAVDDGLSKIENEDLKAAVEDVKDMVFDSLEIDENASVKETMASIFDLLDEKFEIMDNVEQALDEAKSEVEALSSDAQTVSAPSMVPITSEPSAEELEQEQARDYKKDGNYVIYDGPVKIVDGDHDHSIV